MQNCDKFKVYIAKIAKAVTEDYFHPSKHHEEYQNETPERQALIDLLAADNYKEWILKYVNALLTCVGEKPVYVPRLKQITSPFPWGLCIYSLDPEIHTYGYQGMIFCTGAGSSDTPLHKGLYLSQEDRLHQGGCVYESKVNPRHYKPATQKQIDNWLNRVDFSDKLLSIPMSAFLHAQELGVELF